MRLLPMLATAALVAVSPGLASAQDAWDAQDARGRPDTRQTGDGPLDPLLPPAVAETATGTALAITGAAMLADARSGEERCGRIAGCVPAAVDAGQDLDGRYVLGAGLGLAGAGGLTWLLTATSPLDPEDRRDSTSGSVAGSILVGLGASGIGAIAVGSTSDAHETGWNVLLGMGSLASLSVGIPLLATSADAKSPRDRAEDAAEEAARERALATGPTETASPGMMGTGIALTAAGSLTAVGGVAFAVATDTGGEMNFGPLIGAGIVGLGTVMLGVGIPLTVVGARQVPATTEASAPTLRVGPGSIDVRGSF